MLIPFAALASAFALVEPDAASQAAMQGALTRYFKALNTCQAAAARAETTETYVPFWRGVPPAVAAKLDASSCAQGTGPVEVAVLAREVSLINTDTAIGDGYFRTIGFQPERAGRIHVVFVRQGGGAWKIAAVRLARVAFEPPTYAIPIAESHEPPQADGWNAIDAGSVVDLLGTPVTQAWELAGGTFHALRGKGPVRDIRTKDSYRNFELRFEWKVAPAANSGVKYRLFYFFGNASGQSGTLAYEYQIVDNDGDPGAKRFAVERAGSLYNQTAASGLPRPVGEWNEGAVIVKGRRLEHWLNGEKVMETECESSPPEGPIVFQHHGGGASLRNIRIRRFKD